MSQNEGIHWTLSKIDDQVVETSTFKVNIPITNNKIRKLFPNLIIWRYPQQEDEIAPTCGVPIPRGETGYDPTKPAYRLCPAFDNAGIEGPGEYAEAEIFEDVAFPGCRSAACPLRSKG